MESALLLRASLGAALLAVAASSPARCTELQLLESDRQSGSAIAYNFNADEYLVIAVDRDRLASRTIRRLEGRVALGPVQRLNDVGSEPAVAFSAAADRYLTAAIHCRGFGLVLAADGSRSGDTFSVASEPGCDTRAVRMFYSQALERWVVLRLVDDRRIRGVTVSTTGAVEQVALETLPDIEFGELGDFDVAPNVDGGGYLLAWGRAGQLYAQQVDLAAGPEEPRLELSDGPRNRNVTVARAGSRERYLAVWEESQRIYARTLEGDELGETTELTDRPLEAFLPQVVFNAFAGRFLVVWTEQEIEEDLWGRWLDRHGRPLGPSFAVASGPGHQLSFDHNSLVCSERSTECLVTWNDGPPGEPATTIRGRLVEAP